jgi:NADH:ubiquinone reductase (H+-translocating)
VAQILGVKLSGLIAWLLWRCIYLMKMPELNRKARIASDWTLHLLFPPDLAQTKLEPESGIQNQHFEAGDIVFQQGDLGDSVYVIEEGECAVLQEENGARKLLTTLKAGDYFGEMALLSDQSRNATIQARTATNVLIIPKADFDKLRHSVPAFGEIFRALAQQRTSASEPSASASGIPVNTSDSAGT